MNGGIGLTRTLCSRNEIVGRPKMGVFCYRIPGSSRHNSISSVVCDDNRVFATCIWDALDLKYDKNALAL